MAASPSPAEKRKVGRPPRISRLMIAEAADQIGLDNLTLKAVAEHLGVSIAALYHHVSSKDDLLRLGAEMSAGKVPLPIDRKQHWAVWLAEWAVYNREAFLSDPGLLTQYVCGGIRPEAVAPSMDTALGLLVRNGFSIGEARDAYELVAATALGTAVNGLRSREAETLWGGELEGFEAALDRFPAGSLPYIRKLVDSEATATTFQHKVRTVILGLAVVRGENPKKVSKELDRATR